MACGVCDGEGHNKKTCPENIPEGFASLLAPPLHHSDITGSLDQTWDDMPATSVAVYVLLDPEIGVPRYVGQTSGPSVRYSSHSGGAHSDGLRQWFVECERTYLTQPRMKVVSVCSRRDANGLEARLIHGLKRGGYQLLNSAHNKRNCQCVFR